MAVPGVTCRLPQDSCVIEGAEPPPIPETSRQGPTAPDPHGRPAPSRLLAKGPVPVPPVARPGAIPLSPQDQREIERLQNRLKILLPQIALIQRDEGFRDVRTRMDELIRENPEFRAKISPYLEGEGDYIRWLFEEGLRDVQNLFALGEAETARKRLGALLALSLDLSNMGPFQAYQVARVYIAQALSTHTVADLTLQESMGDVGEISERKGLGGAKRFYSFSPQEREAWNQVMGRAKVLLGHLGRGKEGALTETQVRTALGAFGFPMQRLKWIPRGSENQGMIQAGAMAFYLSQDAHLPEGYGEHTGILYVAEGVTRPQLVYALIIYEADQYGLVTGGVGSSGTIFPFGILRAFQEKVLIHRFLAHEAGLTMADASREIEFQRRAEEELRRQLSPLVAEWGETSVSPAGILGKGVEGPRPPISATPLSFGQITPGQRADEVTWAGNGIQSFNEPPPELVHLLGGLEGLPGGPALSIGSGDGCEPLHLAWKGRKSGPQFTEVHAVDYSLVATDRLSRLNARIPATAPIRVIKHDAATYPYSEDTYSFVSAINLLEYLQPRDWSRFLSRVARSLKIGGEFFVAVDLARGAGYNDVKGRKGVRMEGTTVHLPLGKGIISKHFFTRAEVDDLMKRAGMLESKGFRVTIEERQFKDSDDSLGFESAVIRIRREK